MKKSEMLLMEIISLRTEGAIAANLGVKCLTKPLKNSMVKTIEHMMDNIFQYRDQNIQSIIVPGKAFSYSLKDANNGRHLQINGVTRPNCRFNAFNGAMGICEILHRGTNKTPNSSRHKLSNGSSVNPISSLVFRKDIFPLVNMIYTDEIADVNEAKTALKDYTMDITGNATPNVNRRGFGVDIFTHLSEVKTVVSAIGVEIKNLESGVLCDSEKAELKEFKEAYDQEIAMKEILELFMLFVPVSSDKFIETYNGKAVNRDLVCKMAAEVEFVTWYAVEQEKTVKREKLINRYSDSYSLPVHINYQSVESTISQLRQQKEQLEAGLMSTSPDVIAKIDRKQKDINILCALLGQTTKCTVHDNCHVARYTYSSKDDGCGRLSNGNSLQSVNKYLRYAAIPQGHIYDIETSVFSILRYAAVSINPSILDRLPSLNYYIEHKTEVRQALADRVFGGTKVPADKQLKMIKGAMTGIGFGSELKCSVNKDGGAYQSIGRAFDVERYGVNRTYCNDFIADPYIVKLYHEYQMLTGVVISFFRENGAEIIKGKPFTKTKDSELLAHVYQGYESLILRRVLDMVSKYSGAMGFPFDHEKSILPLHDGLYVNWKLDPYALQNAVTGVLGDAHPHILPKFEHTMKYNKTILLEEQIKSEVDLLEHQNRMHAEHIKARQYQL